MFRLKERPTLKKCEITTKGTIAKVNLNDPNSTMIYLKKGVEFNLKIRTMDSSFKVGYTVYINGFLNHCNKDKIFLDPATLRNPKAEFSPK